QIKAGAMIKSITPITGSPGGWRIEFTGGSPSSIDIMNGSDGTPGVTPSTPQIEVRTNTDGTISIWYKTDGDWTDTGTNIKGGNGEPGAPGTNGVSPKVRVVDNGNGTITIQYNTAAGYPDSGWTSAGSPIALGGNSQDREAILSIVENKETGTITITMNDDNDPHRTFDFAMASGAVRFELVGFSDGLVIAPGATGKIKFRVNPSNAYVPTGDMTGTDAKWQLDHTATRASYVTAPTEFALVGIAKDVSNDGELTGQYVATIKCIATQYDYLGTDYAMALVLNAGTAADPALVSSPSFVLGVQSPGIIARGTTGPLEWILYEDYTMAITGEGYMPDYSQYGPWDSYFDEIETVVIDDGVRSIGDRAFAYCRALKEIVIPDGMKTIGSYAFSTCETLTEITLPESVTTIKDGAFAYCSNLTKINIPDGVTSIANAVFYNCTSLAEIDIPDGVTTIGENAFQNCSNLTAITIPASVTLVRYMAFGNCPALANVTCLAETPPRLDYYYTSFESNSTDVLHVPAGSLAAYQDDTTWSDMFESVEPIR
ncbi:MAG: leucine-rich repeat domain-containing protein, partial [Tannerellaceae bacterium]|nr:leucine-rich repeat domain-containing protein [Tannerellaceae bacterium]